MKKKILFINPNKWGRGITTIWIASHTGILKRNGIKVELFDATFYKSWSDYEIKLNTKNSQFKKTNYGQLVKFSENNVYDDLKKKIDSYQPDIIFWSAISSHIHGEGEYISLDYGYSLLENIKTKAILICGGIKATHSPKKILNKYEKINYVISGESEKVLLNILKAFPDKKNIEIIKGISFRERGKIRTNSPQDIISDLDEISPYDYSIFNKQSFLRPYNGKILNAVDYEISRGCIYSCSYCVETIIQKYYGFNEINKKTGSIKNFNHYGRNKSADMIFGEIKDLNKKFNINLFRLQDTNFLTIDRKVLLKLADYIDASELDIKLYIETRAEGINEKSIELLKKLKIDGVGMGLELSDENYRSNHLNRFINQDKIIKAFKLLRSAGINRTAYNIIGLPDQTEDSIIKTLEFNHLISPDTSIAAYYSIYRGTKLEELANNEFEEDDPYGMDPQIRSKSYKHKIPMEILEFYKNNFTYFVKNGLSQLEKKKREYLSK